MAVERGKPWVVIDRLDVIDQEAHAHAAIGGGEQGLDEHVAGGIADDEVVLGVDTALGGVGEVDARTNRLQARIQQVESGQARVGRGLVGEQRAELGFSGVLDGVGGCFVDLLRE